MSDQENKEVEETDQKDVQTPEGTSTDLDTLKSQVADAYIDLIDTTKGSLFQLGAALNMTKAMKDHAKNQLLGKEEKPKKVGFLQNIRNKSKEKLFGGTLGGEQSLLSYDQKDLNIMKTKITNSNQQQLEDLLHMIRKGENPVTNMTTDPGLDNGQVTKVVNIAPSVATNIDTVIDGINYAFPLAGVVRASSRFGLRTHPVTGKKNSMHTGIDLEAAEGSKIFSMTDGEVVENRKTDLGGREIHIKGPDNRIYCYLHMEKESSLQKGTKVVVGQEIGLVGSTGSSTGPHLHLTVKENNEVVNPVEVLPDLFDKDRLSNAA